MTQWTVERVREELPCVQVKIGKVLRTAQLSGRKNNYATVTVSGEYSHALGVPWYDQQFAWKTIVDALNNQVPLVFD